MSSSSSGSSNSSITGGGMEPVGGVTAGREWFQRFETHAVPLTPCQTAPKLGPLDRMLLIWISSSTTVVGCSWQLSACLATNSSWIEAG